jgi:hypothetical protein
MLEEKKLLLQLTEKVLIHRDWFNTQLHENELRNKKAVTKASRFCVNFFNKSSNHPPSNLGGMWSMLKSEISLIALGRSTESEFSKIIYIDQPPWEPEEIALVVGLILSNETLEVLKIDTVTQHLQVASLIWGIVEAKDMWLYSRGPGGCRNPPAYAEGILDLMSKQQKAQWISEAAKNATKNRYSENTKDKKQLAKKDVKDCWDRWRKNPSEYKSKANFARAMLDKYEALGSQPVIASWCTKWEKEATTLHVQ